ncbi:MAG: hypothetical protein IPO92_17070 [Saprospiraceae bacterium]|nr:hypothetical protein [Saprospiraceae bacterium]
MNNVELRNYHFCTKYCPFIKGSRVFRFPFNFTSYSYTQNILYIQHVDKVIGLNVYLTFFLLNLSIFNVFAQDISKLKSENKFELSGAMSLFGSYYSTSDSINLMAPYAYGFSVSPVVKSFGFTMPFNFTYANNKSNLTYPFIRFGAAPSYKWLKVFLGNNTVNFSRFAFSGLNTFGIGIEINPKWYYLGLITGTVTRKIFIDSTSTGYDKATPRFGTKGYAIKTGIKTRNTRLLITYFSGKDDETSLEYFNPKYNLKPRYNKAIGSEIFLRLGRHISVLSYGGMSIYTRNKYAGNLDTLIRASNDEDLPAWTKIIEKNPNASTQLAFAFDNALMLNFSTVDVALRFKQIQPEYKSLGFRFENSDLRQIAIEPAFRFWNNKLTGNFSIGLQKNNLSNKQALQNSNRIYSANISINPSEKLLINLSFSNFGLIVKSSPSFIEDSISVRNVNNNINLNTQYYISNNGDKSASVGVNINAQKTTETYENNPFNNSDFNSFYSNIFYNSTISKGLAYSIGLNYNNSKTHFVQLPDKLYDIQSYGVFSNVSKPLLNKEKLTLGLGGFINLSGVINTDKKIAHGMNVNATYKLTEKLNLNLSYNYTKSEVENKSLSQQYFVTNTSVTF